MPTTAIVALVGLAATVAALLDLVRCLRVRPSERKFVVVRRKRG